PFLIVSAGKLRYYFENGRWGGGLLLGGFLAWGAVSSLSVYPHSLAYFNEVAGGPENGHDHLVNSNIDWGQDLLYLKAWLDEHPEARPLGVAYCNVVGPQLGGIKEFDLPPKGPDGPCTIDIDPRSEEHTSELQS